jgi:uncharacterized protein DUF6594
MSGQLNAADDGDDGYWKLAQFMAKSPNHAMFRGFNALSMLNLLRLQAELQELEDELQDVFQEDRASQDGTRNKYGRSFSHMRAMAETSDTRQLTLLATIEDKLDKYRKLSALCPFLVRTDSQCCRRRNVEAGYALERGHETNRVGPGVSKAMAHPRQAGR